ncbi:MAG: hypothetical protein QOJ50_3652 [Cryptosporangiaceae bacterium]|nr:hypothetical protein [Cryptosporangiaceae bacterium]
MSGLTRSAACRMTVAVAVLAGIGACSSGNTAVAPRAWAKSVCAAVRPWSAEIKKLQSQARKKISTRADVERSKGELITLFAGMQMATEGALKRVKDAGVPQVTGGRRIADQFVHALAAARDSFGTGMSAVQRLPTADQAAFYDGVVAAGDEMSKENNDAGRTFTKVTSPELDRAFNEVPECK